MFLLELDDLARVEEKLSITSHLEDLLRRKVDVIDFGAVDPYFFHQIEERK